MNVGMEVGVPAAGGRDNCQLYSSMDSENNNGESSVDVLNSGSRADGGLASPSSNVSPQSTTEPRRTVYTCRYCNEIFWGPTSYYNHRKSSHPKESSAFVIPSFHRSSSSNSSVAVGGFLIRVCPVCGEHKNSKKHSFLHFMEHMLSHELPVPPITTVPELPSDSRKPFPCDQCEQEFILEMNLDLHKICYHESNLIQLKCEQCGDASSKTWEDLVNHLFEVHKSQTLYSCKSCPMAFITADKMLEHMNVHRYRNALPCPECPSVSTSMKTLYKHFSQSHPNLLTPLRCNICQGQFLMPVTYQRHMAYGHRQIASTSGSSVSTVVTSVGPAKSIQCPHCPQVKLFRNQTSLKTHFRIYHDTAMKKHKCDTCSKSFIQRSFLKYHVQQVHQGIRYQCPHCSKSFTTESLLKGHLKLHNGEGPPNVTCIDCGKKLASLLALKMHKTAKHERNDPVTCDICKREFSNVYSLRSHKSLTHSVKQYSCPHCPRSFARLARFQQHLGTHGLEATD